MSRLERISSIVATGVLSVFYVLMLLYALSNGRPQDLAEFYRGAPAPSPTPPL